MSRVLACVDVVTHSLWIRLPIHQSSLLGSLLAIQDVVLRDLRSDLHESQLDEVLDVLHRDFDILDRRHYEPNDLLYLHRVDLGVLR